MTNQKFPFFVQEGRDLTIFMRVDCEYCQTYILMSCVWRKHFLHVSKVKWLLVFAAHLSEHVHGIRRKPYCNLQAVR